MCYDDFDFDGYDDMDDMDDDFAEEFEVGQEEFDMEAEPGEPAAPESPFDFQDAFILGGMIVGQAYEEALDEKEQQKQQNNEDDGED